MKDFPVWIEILFYFLRDVTSNGEYTLASVDCSTKIVVNGHIKIKFILQIL